MIKSIVFDLDNTLYSEKLYFLSVFKYFLSLHSLNCNLENIIDDTFFLNSKDIFSDFLKKIDFYSQSNQEQLFFIYKTIETPLQLYPDTKNLFSYIKNNNIKTGIITNGVIDAQKNKVRLLGINKYFKDIIYARSFGKESEKPCATPFYFLFNKLNLSPEEVIYIGDNPITDIQGAKKIGCKTIHLKRGYMKNKTAPYADFVIDTLNDVEKIYKTYE